MSELRYHPFLDQWVITATHRQDRTFLPPADYCPLCPTKPGGFPTEVPYEHYDIVVFENKFPSLRTPPPVPAIAGTELMPVRPSDGVCEVVCYTDQHDKTLSTLPLDQIRKLTRVWRDRYLELGKRKEVDYVFIFENKGKEIGVTLSHPHGQIYAYPYIPPLLKIELDSERRHYEKTSRPLMGDWLATEMGQPTTDPVATFDPLQFVPAAGVITGEMVPESSLRPGAPPQGDGPRVVWQNRQFVALVPFFARYPYEVYIAPKVHLRSLADFAPEHLDGLAEALMVVTRKYDRLFGFSMPYIMAMHQAPTIEGYDFDWFHIEFYPPYRTKDKLKYLAGSEAGAGAFINDTLPEEKAKVLRDIDWTT